MEHRGGKSLFFCCFLRDADAWSAWLCGTAPWEVVEWVTKKKKLPIKVHYLGYAASEDRWVGREDVRAVGEARGSRVLVSVGGVSGR